MVNIWRNIFLTGIFFLVLVLMAAMSWLVISMKFRLETLEVKGKYRDQGRVGNKIDRFMYLLILRTKNLSMQSGKFKKNRKHSGFPCRPSEARGSLPEFF